MRSIVKEVQCGKNRAEVQCKRMAAAEPLSLLHVCVNLCVCRAGVCKGLLRSMLPGVAEPSAQVLRHLVSSRQPQWSENFLAFLLCGGYMLSQCLCGIFSNNCNNMCVTIEYQVFAWVYPTTTFNVYWLTC